MLNAGDMLGSISQVTVNDEQVWRLIESPIIGILMNRKCTRYWSERFPLLNVEDVELNTCMVQNMTNTDCIFIEEVFHLNDTTKPIAENWVKYLNDNEYRSLYGFN